MRKVLLAALTLATLGGVGCIEMPFTWPPGEKTPPPEKVVARPEPRKVVDPVQPEQINETNYREKVKQVDQELKADEH
jgi:hypothetical protein